MDAQSPSQTTVEDKPDIPATHYAPKQPERSKALIARVTEGYNKHFRTRFYRRIGIRIASIPEDEREICDRFGEQTISTFLAGGLQPTAEELRYINSSGERLSHSRDWLTERMEIRAWRDWWIPFRDLILEILVVGLIGWEIGLSYQQGSQQHQNFTAQQTVLTAMQKSSNATANTLTDLQSTTNTMSQGVERNAKAAEAASVTATRSMIISERAYVSFSTVGDEPKEKEKLGSTGSILNSGKSPAIDFEASSFTGVVPKTLPLDIVRQQALSTSLDEKTKSKSILGPGQPSLQRVESATPLSADDLSALKDGTKVWYVFTVIRYKDIFNQEHETESCNYYDPNHKIMLLCPRWNIAD